MKNSSSQSLKHDSRNAMKFLGAPFLTLISLLLFSPGVFAWWSNSQAEYDLGDVAQCGESSLELYDVVEAERYFAADFSHINDVNKSEQTRAEALEKAINTMAQKNSILAENLRKTLPTILNKIELTELKIQPLEQDRIYYIIDTGPFWQETKRSKLVPIFKNSERINPKDCTFNQLYKVITNPITQEIEKVLINRLLWEEISLKSQVLALIQIAFYANYESGHFDFLKAPYGKDPWDHQWPYVYGVGDRYFMMRSMTSLGTAQNYNTRGSYQFYWIQSILLQTTSWEYNQVVCDMDVAPLFHENKQLKKCQLFKTHHFNLANQKVITVDKGVTVDFHSTGAYQGYMASSVARVFEVPIKDTTQTISITGMYIYFTPEGYLGSQLDNAGDLCYFQNGYTSAKDQSVNLKGNLINIPKDAKLWTCKGELTIIEP